MIIIEKLNLKEIFFEKSVFKSIRYGPTDGTIGMDIYMYVVKKTLVISRKRRLCHFKISSNITWVIRLQSSQLIRTNIPHFRPIQKNIHLLKFRVKKNSCKISKNRRYKINNIYFRVRGHMYKTHCRFH
mgnify:CR=1 FL=1